MRVRLNYRHLSLHHICIGDRSTQYCGTWYTCSRGSKMYHETVGIGTVGSVQRLQRLTRHTLTPWGSVLPVVMIRWVFNPHWTCRQLITNRSLLLLGVLSWELKKCKSRHTAFGLASCDIVRGMNTR